MKLKTRISVLFSVITFLVLIISMLTMVLFGFLMVELKVIVLHKNITAITTLLLFMLASIIVGMIFYLIVCNMPLMPIDTLTEGMEKLTEGKYETRINLGESMSGKKVAETFNKLAEELDNTELLRSDFINNFSHEFKTPIVSILGLAKILKKCEIDQQKREEYLNAIEEEAERLAFMANSILLMTKVDNQNILTNVKEFNLSEQIRNSIVLKEKSWADKNLQLNIDFLEYNIKGNEELLLHVWNNLIDNAIKYSYTEEELKIEIEKTENKVVVKIINKGSKIPKEERERIFNKFYQVDKSHSSKGNGIGLSICKKIVELHKGNIYVEDNSEKTIFVVELPI